MGTKLLQLKSLVISSPVGVFAARARWLMLARRRQRNPELWEVYLEEKRLPRILEKLLKSDSNCVDVGCHIGSFLKLLLKYSPYGHHCAVEASPTKGNWLKKQYPSVEVLQFAVSDRRGTAIFEEDIRNPGFSHLRESRVASGPVRSFEVEVCRLDDVLSKRIDFMKLDIEGSELPALRGAQETIEKWKPSLLFECGSEYEENVVKSYRRDLFEFLTKNLNYKVYTFSDFLFDKGPLGYDEFRKCGLYPFRAFNFVALRADRPTRSE
jgi:FkbM family methyltransferase